MIRKILTFCLLWFSCTLSAHEAHDGHQGAALAVGLAFDSQGKLWRASVNHGFVEVSSSSDLGKTFSKSVKVNKSPQGIAANGEARPKIVVSPEGYLYLSWTESRKKSLAANIWFSRSINGGTTFEKPYIVHQDDSDITHRLDALTVSGDGRITMVWVAKREAIATKAAQQSYDGAAIYHAVSSDNGVSFSSEQRLADSSCECCRIALATKPDGKVAAMWRHVFEGGERDHMIAEIPAAGKVPDLKRASFGRWKIDGCPHHGPALARGGEDTRWWGYHMAWFDGGNDESGKQAALFYARMDGEAWVTSPPKKFGNMKKQAAHPALQGQGENVWLVWREKDAGKNQIWLMKSSDEGKSWDEAEMLIETAGAADYPILLLNRGQVLLLWNTENAGLKVIAL